MKLSITICIVSLFSFKIFAAGKLRIPYVANDSEMTIGTLKKDKVWDENLKEYVWRIPPHSYSEKNVLYIRTLFHGILSFRLSSPEDALRAAGLVNAEVNVDCNPSKKVKLTCASLFIAGQTFMIENEVSESNGLVSEINIDGTQRKNVKSVSDGSVETSKKSLSTTSK